MAIIAKKDAGITSIKDLKGKRVAMLPGTTQEVFFLERLRMEGMTVKDVEPVRVSFSEMHLALSRGDIDAYVGAEPGPGVSLSSGIGKLVEYPYSTAMGSLNMVFGTHRDVIAQEARPRPRDARHPPAGRPISRRRTMTPNGRDGVQQARAEKGGDRGFGAECRTDMEARRQADRAIENLCRPHAGTEADQAAARFRNLHRHQFRRCW